YLLPLSRCLLISHSHRLIFLLFFFNDTATTEIYTLSLHDALPIWLVDRQGESRAKGRDEIPHTVLVVEKNVVVVLLDDAERRCQGERSPLSARSQKPQHLERICCERSDHGRRRRRSGSRFGCRLRRLSTAARRLCRLRLAPGAGCGQNHGDANDALTDRSRVSPHLKGL